MVHSNGPSITVSLWVMWLSAQLKGIVTISVNGPLTLPIIKYYAINTVLV